MRSAPGSAGAARSARSSVSRAVSAGAVQIAGLGLALQALDHLRGRARADVGVDQRLLEVLPRLGVELVEQRRGDLGGDRLAGLGHVVAQAAEEAAALLLASGLGIVRGGGLRVGDEQVLPVAGHGDRRRYQRVRARIPRRASRHARRPDAARGLPGRPARPPGRVRRDARGPRPAPTKWLRRGASSSSATSTARPWRVAATRSRPEGAEIKRMWVAPAARRRGLGRRLLAALEDAARAAGHRHVVLDTSSGQPEALAMYRALGYLEVPDYNGNPYAAHWFEKAL